MLPLHQAAKSQPQPEMKKRRQQEEERELEELGLKKSIQSRGIPLKKQKKMAELGSKESESFGESN